MLAVELDGSEHYMNAQMEYDKKRTMVLESFGIAVLRFSNIDVEENFKGVCLKIDDEVKKRMKELMPG